MNAEREAKLTKALEQILQTLTTKYRPEKIILFGSMASGNIGEWSDLDLVVIKDTPLPFYQRLKEVALTLPCLGWGRFSCLHDRTSLPRWLLKTISSLWTKCSVKVRSCMSAKLPKQWLDIATEDLTVARLLFKEEHLPHACFLSQQCVEKALKAFLIAKTNTYPRINNLVDLLDLCRHVDPSLAQFLSDCKVVDEYYIPTRYPAGTPGVKPTGFPSASDAKEAIAVADSILNFVRERLS